jgi:hypothetical protein
MSHLPYKKNEVLNSLESELRFASVGSISILSLLSESRLLAEFEPESESESRLLAESRLRRRRRLLAESRLLLLPESESRLLPNHNHKLNSRLHFAQESNAVENSGPIWSMKRAESARDRTQERHPKISYEIFSAILLNQLKTKCAEDGPPWHG